MNQIVAVILVWVFGFFTGAYVVLLMGQRRRG
jgi:hypothetical protein